MRHKFFYFAALSPNALGYGGLADLFNHTYALGY